MPFEPLRTDERIEAPRPRERSMDDLMLAGCGAFVGTSLATYGLAVWPYFLDHDQPSWEALVRASAMGPLPAFLIGTAATRKLGLAAGCGFVAGAMATSVFLHLNIRRMLLAAAATPAGTLPFPPAMVYIVPAAVVVSALVLALAALPRREV